MTAAGRVRVLVWHRPGDRSGELLAEYHRISRAMAGTPGLLGNELWECGDRRVVMSEWADAAAFERWARDPEQHRVTASLRQYRAPGDPPALLCRVVGRIKGNGTEAADAVRGDHL